MFSFTGLWKSQAFRFVSPGENPFIVARKGTKT